MVSPTAMYQVEGHSHLQLTYNIPERLEVSGRRRDKTRTWKRLGFRNEFSESVQINVLSNTHPQVSIASTAAVGLQKKKHILAKYLLLNSNKPTATVKCSSIVPECASILTNKLFFLLASGS
jgi:hypothetical protein